MAIITFVYICPATCNDRRFESKISSLDAEEKCKKHVREAHPDFDPEWYITYPDGLKD